MVWIIAKILIINNIEMGEVSGFLGIHQHALTRI